MSNKSVGVMELLSNQYPEGQVAKVSTDNDFYGVTVVKQGGILVNERTGSALPLSADLMQTKFRIALPEKKELSIMEALDLYEEGKKIKVELGDRYRFIQKPGSESFEQFLGQQIGNALTSMMNDSSTGVKALSGDEVLTIKEIRNGKYYMA